MVELLRHPELRRFARFLVVGVINTLFGYGVFAALVNLPVRETAILRPGAQPA